MEYSAVSQVATCVGCGCNDFRACVSGCYWLRVNYVEHKGVCSQCGAQVKAWDHQNGPGEVTPESGR